MTIRSNAESILINHMAGVRQSEPVIDERLNELQGVVDNPAASLHRLQGKLMIPLSVTSTVWSITQLRFRQGNIIVDHTGPNLGSTRDSPYYTGAVPFINEISPMSDTPLVMGPTRRVGRFPFIEDVRNDDSDAQAVISQEAESQDPRPLNTRTNVWDFNIGVDPASMSLDLISGPIFNTFTVGLWPLAGFGNIKMSWTGNAVISVDNVGYGPDTPVSSGSADMYGFSSDGPFDSNEVFKVTASSSSPANIISYATITISATTATGGVLRTPDGVPVTATLTVAVNNAYPPYTGNAKAHVIQTGIFPSTYNGTLEQTAPVAPWDGSGYPVPFKYYRGSIGSLYVLADYGGTGQLAYCNASGVPLVDPVACTVTYDPATGHPITSGFIHYKNGSIVVDSDITVGPNVW